MVKVTNDSPSMTQCKGQTYTSTATEVPNDRDMERDRPNAAGVQADISQPAQNTSYEM